MKDLCQKWKVKLIFRGGWNSLMAWPDWPPTPLILRQIYAVAHEWWGDKRAVKALEHDSHSFMTRTATKAETRTSNYSGLCCSKRWPRGGGGDKRKFTTWKIPDTSSPPTYHHSVLQAECTTSYRQPTVSEHWRHFSKNEKAPRGNANTARWL